MPPTALSPVPAMIVPPFAEENARPPMACDGIFEPMSRQLPPPLVDSQTPPVAGAAKTRFGLEGRDATGEPDPSEAAGACRQDRVGARVVGGVRVQRCVADRGPRTARLRLLRTCGHRGRIGTGLHGLERRGLLQRALLRKGEALDWALHAAGADTMPGRIALGDETGPAAGGDDLAVRAERAVPAGCNCDRCRGPNDQKQRSDR